MPYDTLENKEESSSFLHHFFFFKTIQEEVYEEASEARERVYELKLRRQEQVVALREKPKQAYLRKQLEKLKAASKTH